MRRLLGLVLVSLLCLPNSSLSNGTRSNTSYSTRTSSSHTKSYCYSCSRDSSGSVKRSSQAKHDFMKSHPCPIDRQDIRTLPGVRGRSCPASQARRG